MRAEFTLQGNIVGRLHNKRYGLRRGSATEIFRSPGKSKVIVGVDEFGNIIYRRLRGLKFNASSLPRLDRNTVNLFDRATERNAFSSAIRKKTVIRGYSVNKSDYREKRLGIGSVSERRKIAKIRKEKELKRQLLRAGINEHKLFLLMHSALHSQTRLEKELPTRPLPPWKRGGISPQERREMEKQRRRNKRLASHGTIYHY